METTNISPRPKVGPKDFFLYLGTIITLYAGTFSVLNLLFGLIDRIFPDQLDYYFYAEGLRYATAALIIIFPIFAILSWVLNRGIDHQSEKRELWVRRWSVFLTLFLSAATIIVDLIFLLNRFLSGELTTRFVLKAIAVLVVAGLIFSYYILYLRGRRIYKIYLVAGLILVIGTLVWSFSVMGSPFTQRQLRFDEQRVGHLQQIQSKIVYDFWQSKGRLPANLSELEDPISGFKILQDPETGASYEYRAISTTKFELCATFSLPSRNDQPPGKSRYVYPDEFGGNWQHDAGRTCFERAIDLELYPPRNAKPGPLPIFD